MNELNSVAVAGWRQENVSKPRQIPVAAAQRKFEAIDIAQNPVDDDKGIG